MWEWCQDRFGSYQVEAREGDGLREGDESNDLRVSRGGASGDTAAFVRSSSRIQLHPTTRDDHVGVRPARALRPR